MSTYSPYNADAQEPTQAPKRLEKNSWTPTPITQRLIPIDESKIASGVGKYYYIPDLLLDHITAQFHNLVREWKAETKFMSFFEPMREHRAYQGIIKMGEAAIPLLLEELNREPDYWFDALSKLTNVDPVPNDDSLTVNDMANIWVEWGIQNSYI